MNLTGSIAQAVGPLSAEYGGSVAGLTGSSAIDTLLAAPVRLGTAFLALIASAGADLGSSLVGPA
jgi:hypothetical protein